VEVNSTGLDWPLIGVIVSGYCGISWRALFASDYHTGICVWSVGAIHPSGSLSLGALTGRLRIQAGWKDKARRVCIPRR